MATNLQSESDSRNVLSKAVAWVCSSPQALWILVLPAVGIGVISAATGYFGGVRPSIDEFWTMEIRAQLETKRPASIFGDFIWDQSKIFFILLLPALAGAMVLIWRKKQIPLGIVVLFFGLLTTAVMGAEISKHWEGGTVSHIGEEPAVSAYYIKLALIIISLMSPAIIWAYFRFCSTMDRYTLQNFAFPFLLCLFGFIAIALLIDLTDNFSDFSKNKASMGVVVVYYVTLLPQIIVLFTPIALLLSLLFTLSKMSRANEIISMLGTGRSMLSILKPVFFVGVMVSLICMALNYYWAPRSIGETKAMIDSITKGEEPDSRAVQQLYVNLDDGRTWYIGRIPFDLNPNSSTEKMKGVEVYGENENRSLNRAWLAKTARWWPPSKEGVGGGWTLYNGHEIEYEVDDSGSADSTGKSVAKKINSFDGDGNPDRLDLPWKETPWQIISLTLKADFLSVPELESYIWANSTSTNTLKMAPFHFFWHYNLALPWTCLVVVLIAAPLGIVYSRRGVLGGVAAAILIFFAIMVVDSIFSKMGKFGAMEPFYAAWGPRFIFGGVGLLLLLFRARNREIPKLNPLVWYRNYRATHAS